MSLEEFKHWLWRSRRRIKVWGYFVEATVSVRAMFRQRMPKTRSVIFAQGRTGSELLCSLLHSHSQIHCDKELLNQPVLLPHRLIRCFALLSKCDTYGFKVKIQQLVGRRATRDVRSFLVRLHEQGWKIIFLSRRNQLRQVVSNILRAQSGKAHRYRSRDGSQPVVEKIDVDCEDLRRELDRREFLRKREEEALFDLPCLRVVYDDDLHTSDQQQQTMRRIVSWLGLEHEPLNSDLVRNTPERLIDLVRNYEEMAASLTGTEFERYIEE